VKKTDHADRADRADRADKSEYNYSLVYIIFKTYYYPDRRK
jgi:hypothetical protein